MAKRTKLQREHFNYFHDLMRQIKWDVHHQIVDERRIPPEWHTIARAKGRSEKIRITLRVEADVVRFFRKMGKGYQQRMNDVLSAWMHGRIAALINGPDSEDVLSQAEEFGRPHLGEGELALRGLVRRQDGTLFDLEKGEVVVEE
jgi:uncharacterized protein (DUF4415 family)